MRTPAAVVVAGLVASLVVPALAAPAQAAQPSDCTVLVTLATASHARALRGASAIAALGTDLVAAAAVNHMSATALSTLLTQDRTSRLDQCGRVFFEDTALDPSTPAADPTTATEAAATLDPSGDAFALASRPGSHRTIYLDFVGFTLTGTQWNTSYSLPSGYQLSRFDTDGYPASFSTNELAQIRSIWLRVAEDYAPFDVNVTTADPGLAAIDRSGSADLAYGTRAVITDDTTVMNACGCGGIAYVNVVGATYAHETVQPALVFVNNLARDAKAIGEASSHEVGHNFGLRHDGSVINGVTTGYYAGQGAWAPIMGNSYNSPITQWSKGEYAGATNTEDDVATIALNAPYVTGEAGTSLATAPDLQTGVAVGAVVTSAADSDYFAVTSLGGDLSVAAVPQAVSPNLDVRLDVYDPDGSLRATIDPATPTTGFTRSTEVAGMSATWTATGLPAGRYVVKVSGTGAGSPTATGYSSYGSVGRYTVTATVSGTPVLDVATPVLPDAVVGTAYAAQLAADHADGATRWTVAAGSLPDGLALDEATGAVTGTPTSTGTASVTVEVAEADGHYATRAFSLPVYTQVGIATTALAGASYGRIYSTRLVATGGDARYVFTRVSGSLPRGFTLTSAGVLTGTSTVTGRYVFTVAVTDDGSTAQLAGRTALRTYSLWVTLPVRITTTSLVKGYHGRWYATRVYAAAGTGLYGWARVAGSFPRGITMSDTGRITGRTSAHGRFTVTLRVRDSQGRTSSKVLSLTIV